MIVLSSPLSVRTWSLHGFELPDFRYHGLCPENLRLFLHVRVIGLVEDSNHRLWNAKRGQNLFPEHLPEIHKVHVFVESVDLDVFESAQDGYFSPVLRPLVCFLPRGQGPFLFLRT